MSFDLRIRFEGLCLFVPEDGARMHVLMPSTPAGDMRHHARLVYDRAYERPAPKQYERRLACVSLEQKALDLTRFTAPALNPFLPDEIPPLREPNDTLIQVPRSSIGATPGADVVSRVSLGGGLSPTGGSGAGSRRDRGRPSA